ncbi:MAG TPA: helix-turn-helix transcriptional regulator [Bacillota bacterium]|nr:helix-turn-helix transcriptional regulator [Bacillota bacterium]
MENNIAKLRKERKITQEELADAVSVTRQTIISIENGRYMASLPLAFKIAEFFEKTIEDIFVPGDFNNEKTKNREDRK